MNETIQPFCQDVLSRLSHEIRNPLTLICSSLQLLEADCPSVTHSDLWPQINEDLQSVFRLLNDISSLSRQQMLHISNVCAESFLSSAAASFRSMAVKRKILFSADLSAAAISPVTIACDEIKLREAILNLLVNAADAVSSCPSGSVPQILLQAACSGQNLHIHVKDNGPGIPENYLPTLFDPFVTYKSGGTGLGLHIVKTIAEQHHGTVTVHTCCTSGNSGTDFCISLPLIPDHSVLPSFSDPAAVSGKTVLQE